MSQRYGDTYGTSEMYAAGVASMGGADHFNNPLNDQQDQYDLNAAALTAVQSGVGPSDLLMGLASGDPHSFSHASNLTKEQLAAQQEAIRAHPLYPFLTVLFERCELATSTPRDLSKESGCRPESAADQFKDDLMAFVKSRQEDKMRYYVADPELDKLILSAIQVLRLHLLELEKVHELCDHFCQRYVNSLKEQMQMDMMHEERASSVATNNTSPVSPSVGPSGSHQQQYQPQQAVYEPQIVNLPESMHPGQQQMHQSSDTSGSGFDNAGHPSHTQPTTSTPSTAPTPSSGGSMTPNGQHLNQHHQQQQDIKYHAASSAGSMSPSHSRNGSTPNTSQQHGQSLMHDDTGDDNLSIGGSLHDEGRDSPSSDHNASQNASGDASQSGRQNVGTSNGKRKVPKVFSKEAITKFRAWLFQNLQHPYPSEEQKKQLAQETNLTILQVNNWFINARRRIVQPMIDSNNRAGRSPHCNNYRNRRRRNSETSPTASPSANDANATTSTSHAPSNNLPNSYSPGNDPSSVASTLLAGGATSAPYPAAMFPTPYGFPTPSFTTPMFMPNVAAAYSMNPAQMGAPDWMGFGGGSMDS
ncbi:Homeobox protein homothorax [Aphelenchoides bicaudatus]|nr:Homeobox protein homothorax [Aphelenchoides bicaudatus]